MSALVGALKSASGLREHAGRCCDRYSTVATSERSDRAGVDHFLVRPCCHAIVSPPGLLLTVIKLKSHGGIVTMVVRRSNWIFGSRDE